MLNTMEPLPTIPEFEVLALLGYGARSTIYAVSDRKTKQLYALKRVLRRSQDDDRFVEQAEQEFSICSQFDHPALRRSHRMIKRRKFLKVTELYLLMDLFDGTALDAQKPTSMTSLTRIFIQVAEGLGAMHRLGFLHADIKPNNILVNDEAEVKIIDFGQSCAIGTMKQRIQGTPDYIAPEQVSREPLTVQTDIFNLGATMFWCVTDKHIPTSLVRKDVVRAKNTGPLVPPHELNPRIPLSLSKLIFDCVQTDPAQRPSDMNIVRARLEMGLPPSGSGPDEETLSKKTGVVTAAPDSGDKKRSKT
jgi:eukaryotic-like serine/threonine-protein kinase